MTSCMTDLRVLHVLLRVSRRLSRVLRKRKRREEQELTARVRFHHQHQLTLHALSSSSSSLSSRKTTTKGVLTQEHLEPIIARKWKSVLAWITFSPHELYWTDKNKQTALHHACLFRAPLDVIELMLQQAPEMAKMANTEGEIPLHWAIRLSASTEVIRLLLSVYPSSAVDAQDTSGTTALSLMWERHQHPCLQSWWHNGVVVSAGNVRGSEQRNNQKLLFTTMRAWDQMMFYIKAKYNDTTIAATSNLTSSASSSATATVDGKCNQLDVSNGETLELHCASSCACPPALYPLVARVYAHQIFLVDSKTGMTPLELACSDPIANRCHDVQSKIQVLLSMIMPSTSISQAQTQPSTSISQPQLLRCLRLALESGVMWHEGIQDLIHCCNVLDTQQQQLQVGSNTRQDRNNYEYKNDMPLVLHAAMGSHRRAKLVQENKTMLLDDRSLDTIYLTLRMDPTQIEGVTTMFC